MHHEKKILEELIEQINLGLETVDLPKLNTELAELDLQMLSPDFWDDSSKAQVTSKNAADIKQEIELWENIKKEADDLWQLLPMIEPEKQPEEAEEFRKMLSKLDEKWKKLNIATFLSDKFDAKSAIITIHCGLGGKDAQDFAQMLLRMYTRYLESQGFGVELFDQADGEEVGIKQASLRVNGRFAYGYLKYEQGVHRLIRLSPFNSGNTRETSFSRIEVVPQLDFADHVEIKTEDLRIDTYRASGAGGQHVNTTDSAVRITHLPTGVVVQCQNERSQAQNKERAMEMLQGRLQKLMHDQQLETIEDLKGNKTEMAWGHQIRTYTLHPYSLVKDHRTNHEVKNAEKTLDGVLHSFIEANLVYFA